MMTARKIAGLVFLAASVIPFGFLVYTLTHLARIGIAWYHPRVLVEAGLFAAFMALGMVLALTR